MKLLKIFSLFFLFITPQFVDAHSVQIQYCVNCDGDLRIWVEHWHGTQNPASTTMTISLDINGTSSTQTSAPGGGVQNMPFGSLPGCSTPIIYGAGCPGDQNTYNDWVYYDFVGIPQNVPITFTILSGNTAFTDDGCNMYPLAVNFTIQGVGQVDDQDICSGEVTSSINFPNDATWINDNPSIGIAPSGTGPIPSFNPIGPVGTTANINYTNGCGTGIFVYTIQPAPTPGSTSSSGGVNSNSTCLGNAFDFVDNSTVPAPYVINGWLWDFGDGNTSLDQHPSHTYDNPGVYNITFTAESDIGCGSSTTFPVTVYDLPVAGFTSDVACATTATTLTDQSNAPNSVLTAWEWDILNNNTTDYNTTNANHTFATGGSYDVELIVTSADGCKDTVVNPVLVNYLPVVSFTSDSVCVGSLTTLTNTSTVVGSTISTINWLYGDGNNGTGSPITHTYPNAGDFNTQLDVISAQGCTNTTINNVYVRELPVADFTINDACYYNSVTTNNTSIINIGTMTYSWDFADGSALNSSQTPTHDFANAGVYNVSLTATSNFNCVHATSHSVNVYDKPVADFAAATVCLNAPTLFNDNSYISNIVNGDFIDDWKWDINNDLSIETNTQNGQYYFLTEGGFTTALIATTNYGCVDTVVLPVDVWPLPEVDFNFVDLCLNDVTHFSDLTTISNNITTNNLNQYSWDFGDNTTAFGSTPNHVFGYYGNFNVDLEVTSDHGCSNNMSQIVYIRPLPTPEFSSSLICINTPPTTFTNLSTIPDGSIVQYDWVFGDGHTGSGPAVTNQYASDGVFNTQLTTTSNFGCVNTISHPVIVYEKPTASFTSDVTQVCSPGSVNFQDLSYSNTSIIDAWQWNMFNGSTPNIQNPNVSYLNETDVAELFDVELIATNSYGCSDTVFVQDYIAVIPQPTAVFSFAPTLLTINESETEFSNQSTLADFYSWNFGDNSALSNEFEPIHEFPATPATYIVELIASNYGGFCRDTALATVHVQDVLIFYVPNIFTPDNDAFNEVWHPIFTAGYDPFDFHLLVFNRYGEVVWESFDASAGWNGHYSDRGGLVEDGVYVWQIEFKETMSDKRHKETGFVTILK